jgi:hypothetical protein
MRLYGFVLNMKMGLKRSFLNTKSKGKCPGARLRLRWEQ